MRSRLRLPGFIGFHLLVSAAAAAVFAWQFGHGPRAVAAHILVLAEWDLALPAVLTAFAVFISRPGCWARLTYRVVLAATCTLQVYLYALNVVSNVSLGRNIPARLVSVF